ncbi:MAG: phytoene desaturase family protein [Streptosporangiaceae bacterium]
MTQDAVVVGSGPNGLAAAITLARAGLGVTVFEGTATPGGGCRTEELTLPGLKHDVCSAVHPLAAASPFFRSLNMPAGGITMLTPAVAFAHPLDGGRAAAVTGDVASTAAGLGADAMSYGRLLGPLVAAADGVLAEFLAPLRSVPAQPRAAARFLRHAVLPASVLARRFSGPEARALLAGASAHSFLRLSAPGSGGYGLLLMMLAHHVGWPVVEGGSARLTDAMVAELESLGSAVVTGRWISSLRDLPAARVTLLDVTPRQFTALAGPRLPDRYARALARFRYGPGIFKVDWALSGPVPWAAAACRSAGTVHLGGSLAEIASAEAEVWAGRHPERPFAIVAQAGVVDPSRAPAGRQVLWGYCHVPAGSSIDMTARIEAQIERFAPGFGDLILARSTRTAAQLECYNPNYIGGDVNGGQATVWQTLFRPVPRWNTYRTPLPGVYLCSASTPPGGGVHGMCGMWAARSALADLRG